MTVDGMLAARRVVAEVSSVVSSLTEQDWPCATGRAGWRVQDVVASLAAAVHQTADVRPTREPVSPMAARALASLVEARRGWAPSEVAQEYLDYAPAAVEVWQQLQAEPRASTVAAFPDFGHHPLHLLADRAAFEHYCRLRIDMLAPTGPLARDLPPPDDLELRPAVRWLLTCLPQLPHPTPELLRTALRLDLTGPGGGSWVVWPPFGGAPIAVSDDPADCRTTVASTAHDFLRWATKRADWRTLCTVAGDYQAVAPFLDRLKIA